VLVGIPIAHERLSREFRFDLGWRKARIDIHRLCDRGAPWCGSRGRVYLVDVDDGGEFGKAGPSPARRDREGLERTRESEKS